MFRPSSNSGTTVEADGNLRWSCPKAAARRRERRRTAGRVDVEGEGPLPIQGEYRLAAPREAVWRALNDPEVLQACIPGCEQFTKKSDTDIDARIQAALGPVRAAFATRIEISELNPPASYVLSGEGKAAAGFGKGVARVELTEESPAVTVLRYSAELKLGGKLAQVGSRLLEGATRQLADQFFDAFAKRLDAGATRTEAEAQAAQPNDRSAAAVGEAATAPGGEAAAPVAAPAPAAGSRALWWVVAALAAAALIYWLAG